MIVAAEEGAKDWPSGVFFSDDGSAHRMNCLGHGDSATHSNNSYKDSVSMLWYGPDNMAVEQVQFIATVVVNVTIYYTNIRSGWIRVDPSLPARGGGDGVLGVTADPWLLGNEQSDPWSTGRGTGGSSLGGGSSWGGSGTGSTWGRSGTGSSSWGGTGGSSWGSGTGNLWGDTSGTSSWGSGSGAGKGTGTGNQWDWNNQGWGKPGNNQGWGNQGKGSGSSWNWNNQGQSSGKGTSTGSGTGSGSNWNWGQTTTAAWDSKTRAWEATTTEAPSATKAAGSAGTNQQVGTGSGSGMGTQTGSGSTGTTATDTKQSSIDWIKNIPTQTWYEILRRLGFNVDSSSTASSGKQATVKK